MNDGSLSKNTMVRLKQQEKLDWKINAFNSVKKQISWFTGSSCTLVKCRDLNTAKSTKAQTHGAKNVLVRMLQ